jgi:hypothetical protein
MSLVGSACARIGRGAGLRLVGRYTGEQRQGGVSQAAISRVLRRLGLNWLSALDPTEPVRRYERAPPRPGEPIHIDVKHLYPSI